jgi:hypothetical protein
MEFLNGDNFLLYLLLAAAILHASLQLPLATLLYMAAHTVGRGKAKHNLALGLAFSLGAFLTVAGLLVVALIAGLLLPEDYKFMAAGLLTVLSGLGIMFGYFRGKQGSQLWFSRKYMQWFHHYIERRHSVISAFSLGNLSVLLELVFSLPLLLSVGLLLSSSSSVVLWQNFIIYGLIVTTPLIVAAISLSGGTNILKMQNWRAESKRFWQFFVGLGFILFGFYVASEPVINRGVYTL